MGQLECGFLGAVSASRSAGMAGMFYVKCVGCVVGEGASLLLFGFVCEFQHKLQLVSSCLRKRGLLLITCKLAFAMYLEINLSCREEQVTNS